MKNITKKQKIIIAIIALIIIAGIAVIASIGFNFDLKFQKTEKVELYLGKSFEVSDMKEITKEVMLDQKVIIQKIEVYEDSVRIIAKDITEEQKTNLINKINEKYDTELSVESTEIVTVPNTRGRDFIKPYIMPFVIATAMILVYMSIRYKNLGISKVLLKTVIISIIAQVVLFSIIAIARIPVGRLTIPMIILVYLLTLLGITTKFEKRLKEVVKKQEN